MPRKNRKLKLSDVNPTLKAIMTLQSRTAGVEKRIKTLTIKKITDILTGMDNRKVEAIHKMVIEMAKAY